MEKWFEKQSRLVQLLLLLIPGVNWVVEVLVRLDHAQRKGTLLKWLIALLTIPFGMIFGWLDLVWSLLFKHLFLCD